MCMLEIPTFERQRHVNHKFEVGPKLHSETLPFIKKRKKNSANPPDIKMTEKLILKRKKKHQLKSTMGARETV